MFSRILLSLLDKTYGFIYLLLVLTGDSKMLISLNHGQVEINIPELNPEMVKMYTTFRF